MEVHRSSELQEALGIANPFVQSNVSTSVPYVLRGMHYQVKAPQGKLVRCLQGRIFDVAVDLREDSPTLGKWYGAVLDDQQCVALWVPPGFAHGFLAMAQGALVHYECSTYYVEQHNRCLKFDDPTVGIRWPLAGHSPVISNKDRAGAAFEAAERVAL